MRTFIYDYDTEMMLFPKDSAEIPQKDLLMGKIYDESEPPTIILDPGKYNPSLDMDYFAEILSKNLGVPISPDDILIGKSKTSSFPGDIALYNGEILPIMDFESDSDWKTDFLQQKQAKIVDLTLNIDVKRLKTSNILDPIHETLDQAVFNGNEPDLPVFLRHIHKIKRIFKESGFNPADFEFFLTGSLCTYQYHATSDVDISILPKIEDFSDEKRSFLISVIVNELDGEPFPGTFHEYQHYLQPNGVNIYDLFAVGMRGGYDFQTEKWVQKPDRLKAVDIEKSHPDWIAEAIQVSDKINTLLDEGFDEEAQTVYADIHTQRKEDELLVGDESPGNVIYKFLDNNGTFERLREIGQYIA